MKRRLFKLSKEAAVAIPFILLIFVFVISESIIEPIQLCGMSSQLLGGDCVVAYNRGSYINFLPDGQHTIRSISGRSFAVQPISVNPIDTFSTVEFGLDELDGHDFYMSEHVGSADTSRVAACVNPDSETDEIWVWNVDSQIVIQKIPDSNCKRESRPYLFLSEDGKFIVSSAGENVQLFNLESKEIFVSEGKGQAVVSSAQDLLAFVEGENTIKLVDINGNAPAREILLPNPIEDFRDAILAISQNGSLVALNDAGNTFVWQITDGSLMSILEPTQGAAYFSSYSISFSPDGNFIVSNAYHWNEENDLIDGYVYIWNIQNGKLQWQRKIGEEILITAVSMSPNNDLVAVGTGQGSFIFETNIGKE